MLNLFFLMLICIISCFTLSCSSLLFIFISTEFLLIVLARIVLHCILYFTLIPLCASLFISSQISELLARFLSTEPHGIIHLVSTVGWFRWGHGPRQLFSSLRFYDLYLCIVLLRLSIFYFLLILPAGYVYSLTLISPFLYFRPLSWLSDIASISSVSTIFRFNTPYISFRTLPIL